MSIGVFWQMIFCCSCPSAVEWPTSTHQTIPIGGHFYGPLIKTRLFQLAYFIWLCKCMYVYFMLSIMNRLGLTRSYVTCTFASALVNKGQISIWHICLILKRALYKYHIIIILLLFIRTYTNTIKYSAVTVHPLQGVIYLTDALVMTNIISNTITKINW